MQALSFNNYVWQLIHSQLPTLLQEKRSVSFTISKEVNVSSLSIPVHAEVTSTSPKLMIIWRYICLTLATILYQVNKNYSLESLYLNWHSSIQRITSDLAPYINVCYNPLLGEYNLKIPLRKEYNTFKWNYCLFQKPPTDIFSDNPLCKSLKKLHNLLEHSISRQFYFACFLETKKSHAAFRTSSTLNFRWAFSSLEEEWSKQW